MEKILWEGSLDISDRIGFASSIYLNGLTKVHNDVYASLVDKTYTNTLPQLEHVILDSNTCLKTSDLLNSLAIKVSLLPDIGQYYWGIASVLGTLLFTELPCLNTQEVRYLDRLYDVIITPSEYVANLLKKYGVQKPLHILKPGIDITVDDKKETNSKYTFGVIGYSETDNINIIREAFYNAFTNNLNVRLIILDMQNQIFYEDRSKYSIKISWRTIKDFYREIDCLIRLPSNPNHNWFEQQAIANNIPVIATLCGSIEDLTSIKGLYFIDVKTNKFVIDKFIKKPRLVYEPNIDMLIETMRRFPPKIINNDFSVTTHTWNNGWACLLRKLQGAV